MYEIPSTGFIRLKKVLEIIPISKSSFWAGIKAGKYPKGVHLGPRTRAWPVEEIRSLISSIKQGAQK
jgi:prophage regulatory protein